MYRVERRFTFPMGHRLSKHKGACSNFHGHNIVLLVGVESIVLNSNDMVIDFSDLKKIVEPLIKGWDHSLILNTKDFNEMKDFKLFKKVLYFNFDPTAEKLSEYLFQHIKRSLPRGIKLEYVKFYENENSMATYSER